MRIKIKAIGIYQIVGGIIGLGLIVFLLLSIKISGLLILLFLFGFAQYSYSVFSGVLLLKLNPSGFRHSIINQYLQLVNIAVLGYAYKYVAGIYLFVGVNLTDEFLFNINFGFSQWLLNINTDNKLIEVNLNLVAVYLIIVINRSMKKLNEYKVESDLSNFGNEHHTAQRS